MLQVIIGRFQTNQLHQGHLELIRKGKTSLKGRQTNERFETVYKN